MKLELRGTLASIAAGGLLVIALAAPAYATQAASPLAPEGSQAGPARPCAAERTAAKDDGVGNLRKLGDCEINRRLVTLTVLGNRVATAGGLTTDHRTTLAAQLAAATSGLTALRAQIDAETDKDALRADLGKIVTDYRIYLLVAPKTAEVIAADAELAAVARLEAQSTKLQARIDTAKAAGKDVALAQAHLDTMNAKLVQVPPLAQGVPAAVLPLTPAQYNAGTAKPILASSHASLQGGRSLLNAARAEALACVAALRALR